MGGCARSLSSWIARSAAVAPTSIGAFASTLSSAVSLCKIDQSGGKIFSKDDLRSYTAT